MKKHLLFLTLFLIQQLAFCDSGIFQTYVTLNQDNAGNTDYHGGFNADSSPNNFNGRTFSPTASLVLNGGAMKTWKNNGSNVTGAKVYYRLYKDGTTPGAFIEIDLPYNSELGGGDQRWEETNSGIDLFAMATSNGTWKIEVYWKATSSDGDHFDSDFGNNFTAEFDVTSLPVSFSTFKSNLSNAVVYLNWTTQSENNNKVFEIEKSVNGRDYELIGSTNGAGTSTQENTYVFKDVNPAFGLNYYRVKQIDFDNQFSYSDVISIRYDGAKEIVAFPNPVMDFLNLNLTKMASQTGIVQLLDISGRVLIKENISDTNFTTINMQPFTKGIYLLQIIGENGRLITKQRIVKQ